MVMINPLMLHVRQNYLQQFSEVQVTLQTVPCPLQSFLFEVLYCNLYISKLLDFKPFYVFNEFNNIINSFGISKHFCLAYFIHSYFPSQLVSPFLIY